MQYSRVYYQAKAEKHNLSYQDLKPKKLHNLYR